MYSFSLNINAIIFNCYVAVSLIIKLHDKEIVNKAILFVFSPSNGLVPKKNISLQSFLKVGLPVKVFIQQM